MTRRVRKRLQPTLGDYLAIAVGPILIGLLVGSMVFFLIEVFYQGQFGGRLQFIMAWFVVGAVGISRISIEDGREQAVLFAVPLGILVAIAAWRFVEFSGPLRALSPFLSIGLVGLIWWSTDCLTWDCTVIDDDDEGAETSGGLLETAGLDATGEASIPAEHDAVTTSERPRQSIWERFVEYRRRPHAPGVWVLYFSLAALPLFGLGQIFLPTDDEAVRRRAFLLLVVYVASGLGLLLVTSFVNLRRYLRQRRLTMPVTMAATWVVSGTLLIAGILLVCLVLAGRGVGYSVTDLPVVASIREGLTTSRWAMQGEGREDAEGTRLRQREDAQRLREGNAENEVAAGKAEPNPAGKSAGAEQSAERRPPATQPQADDSAIADGAEASPPNDSRDQGGSERGSTNAEQANDQPGRPEQAADDQAAADARRTAQADGERSRPTDSHAASGEPSSESPTPPQPPEIAWSGGWLKAIGWILLAIVLGVGAWWYRSAIGTAVRALLEAIAAFWERLFGGVTKGTQKATAEAAVAVHRRRTFAEFTNPFASGRAERVSTEELIRYSFEAFEAWSGDRGFCRRPQQTAHEFAEVVGERLPAMERDVRQLAELVSWAAFSGAPVPRSGVKPLARLWQRMQTPVDAGHSSR
jgi:hypothetical protein